MRGMSVSGLLPRVIVSRSEVLLATLLVTGFLAGCGPSAGSATAAEPKPAGTSGGQLDSPGKGQVVAVEPTDPGDAPPAVVAQPVSQPEQTADTPEARRAELSAIDSAPRHQPSALTEPARPSRIKAGIYRCSVGDGYKLRECRVEKDADGRTLLEIGAGNLVSARGVVWDDGAASRFEGWLTDQRPFGCFSCQDRCYINPGSCGCDPAPLAVAKACVAQPVSILLNGAGNQFTGKLSYSHFYATYEGVGGARELVPGKTAQSYPVRLMFQKALSSQGSCGAAGSAGPPCGNYRPTPNRGGALDPRH